MEIARKFLRRFKEPFLTYIRTRLFSKRAELSSEGYQEIAGYGLLSGLITRKLVRLCDALSAG
jgi:hypothetical protein